MILERLLGGVSPEVGRTLERALEGRELASSEAETLLGAEGGDFHALLRAADIARAEDVGDDISFVVCRNINFTNVCYVGCSFCGFARHKDEAEAFDHPMAVMINKARDAVARRLLAIAVG